MMQPVEKSQRESLLLRVFWMVVFVFVWQLAELLLAAVVVLQLGWRLFTGALNADLLELGDSLSQYVAQIGRFGTFNSDEKPWPFAEWPAPQRTDPESGGSQ
jgi:hypothetical protein